MPSDQGGHPDGSVQDGSSGSGGSGGSSGGGSGSTSGGGSGGSSGSSSGGGSGGSSGSSSGGGSGSSSGSSSGGFDAGCGASPTLHMYPAGTIFCALGPDAGTIQCTTGQECCVGGAIVPGQFAPDVCTTFAGTCPNGSLDAGIPPVPIECTQLADCAANGLSSTACCLRGATAPAAVPGCSYPKSKGGSDIVCEGTGGGAAKACAAGEVNICSSQSDCPAGTTCTPGKWKLFQLGFCL